MLLCSRVQVFIVPEGIVSIKSDQIKAFVASNTDARLQASPGHLMPQFRAAESAVPDNQPGDHDGFFYAVLEKRLP